MCCAWQKSGDADADVDVDVDGMGHGKDGEILLCTMKVVVVVVGEVGKDCR
jgi:hypothetical protein